jgi:hypothetical protein
MQCYTSTLSICSAYLTLDVPVGGQAPLLSRHAMHQWRQLLLVNDHQCDGDGVMGCWVRHISYLQPATYMHVETAQLKFFSQPNAESKNAHQQSK